MKEMLELPDYLENLVPDYKMNLLQLRNSENLKFKNKDVQTIFDVSRLIYGKNYGKITSIYKDQNLTNEWRNHRLAGTDKLCSVRKRRRSI